MQRTDRLFEIIQILRAADGPVPAAAIAARMELSVRTIYRHVATLQAMRLPIEGAPGLGYVMRAGYDLPPIALDAEEREAVAVGLGLLARTGDRGLVAAAGRVLDKITDGRSDAASGLGVSGWGIPETFSARTEQVRAALREGRALRIAYRALDGTTTERTVEPRALVYYIEVAVLEAWCRLRGDVRHFRVDRIEACEVVV
ncbi:MAG: YafY family protein [Pseudomonadota bacterium]